MSMEKRLNLIEDLIVQNSNQVNGLITTNGGLIEASDRTNRIINLLYNHVKEVKSEFDSLKMENEKIKNDMESVGIEIETYKTELEKEKDKANKKTEEALGHLKDATEIFISKTKMRIAPNGYGNLTEIGELFDGKIGAAH